MNKRMATVICLVVGGLLFTSCPSRPTRSIALYKLTLGMTKLEVLDELGDPFAVIGSKAFEEGTIEVWEYRQYGLFYSYTNPNQGLEAMSWLYFLNDRLEQWGRPGDWSREADRIYELRVK